MTQRAIGARLALAGAVMAGLAGCGVIQPTPTLPADAFVQNQAVTGPGTGVPADHSGPLIYGAHHRPPRVPAAGGEDISETVRESVTPPGAAALAQANADASAAPATAPSSAQGPGPAPMQFQWVATVLAVVNDEPIHAHKVLEALEKPLATEARTGSEEHFRTVAEDLVGKQIREFIDNDLEFAAAQRSLEKQDTQIANFLTTEWRKEQVRKAGGSEALARQRAAENGDDFEELGRQQFRLNMIRLYYQKKIIPLVQVSAQDMRDYYQSHAREFEKSAAARFRVIFISAEKAGGTEAALEKARRQVYEPARRGDDFTDLAAKINDDAGLRDRKGAVGDQNGWMEKGAYAIEKVEQAVWDLKPGEVTDPIGARNHGESGFFVAKLEVLQSGRREPFESQKVQDDIRETLRRTQFARLRDAHRRDLVQKAVIHENPHMREAAMEMVMQRYRVWVASR